MADKPQQKTQQSVGDLMVTLSKAYGAGTVKVSSSVQPIDRQPTGIFALDLMTGGGWPRGKFNIIYGPESANKTNICYKTIAHAQKLYPDEVCVFVDVEHSFDPIWAALMGVDTDKLMLLQPEYGEQAVDMMDSVLMSTDVGVVVLDSIAAMNPLKYLDDPSEKAQVGGNAVLVQKLMQRTLHRLTEASNEDRAPTVIAINQIRYKIGVMFGDPEKMPGGKSLEHMSGLTLRSYAKPELDKEISATIPTWKKNTISVRKAKVPVVAHSCEFLMGMINTGGVHPGMIKDYRTVLTRLKDLGWATQGDKKWHLLDVETGKTQQSIIDYLKANPVVDRNLRAKIIEHEVSALYDGDTSDA
jgi:recombination protein RecA